jgi:uncharacterized membrane protein YbaN (DUF454 family)
LAYQFLGLLAVALAIVGIILPLLPTVPFLLLAAFLFARSHPEWERKIVEHPRFGPPIQAWRERRAIGAKSKATFVVALGMSGFAGLLLLDWPWSVAPLVTGLIAGTWILTRPS